MMEIDAAGNARLGLEAGNVGREKVPPGSLLHAGQGKQCRQHGRRRVATHAVATIVEVERVRGRAVDQCGIERGNRALGAKQQCGAA